MAKSKNLGWCLSLIMVVALLSSCKQESAPVKSAEKSEAKIEIVAVTVEYLDLSKIKKGLTTDQVLAFLGEPEYKIQSGEHSENWFYNKPCIDLRNNREGPGCQLFFKQKKLDKVIFVKKIIKHENGVPKKTPGQNNE